MIVQIFIPFLELVIPTGTQTNEANAGTETQPVIVEAKIESVQHNLNTYIFLYFSLIKSLCFISSKR